MINSHVFQTLQYILAKGGVPEDSLVVALNDGLIADGYLVVEHGSVYVTAAGCRAVNSYHVHEWSEVSRRSVFDSNGRYRGEIVERSCWCGEDKTDRQIIRDGRQRNPFAVL